MVYYDQDERAGLRDYVQLSKHTHAPSCNKPGSVHALRTEGVIRSEEREGANGVAGGIGLGDGIVHGNAVGGGTGAGMRTKVEVNKGTPDGSGNGSGNEAGTGTRTGREREQGREWKPVKEYRMKTGTGAGMETRAVADI